MTHGPDNKRTYYLRPIKELDVNSSLWSSRSSMMINDDHQDHHLPNPNLGAAMPNVV